MLEAIIKHLKPDKRGISNVIVVMLSLVLIVVIVANVVLWGYQMNQFDWERTQEEIEIVDVTSVREVWSSNPSGYVLGGSTSLVSGGISNLTSDDGIYMTFKSYYSGTDSLNFVDNNASNVDSSADKGKHSNFTAQQYGPDSIYDTLQETNTASGETNITLVNEESFENDWPPSLPSDWTESGRWNKESNRAYDGTYSADFDGLGIGRSGDLTTCNLNCSDADAIYVEFWYRDEGCEANEFLLQYYNGTNWNTVTDLGLTTLEYQWLHYQEKITDSQYFKSTFKVRWSAVDIEGGEHVYVDFVTVKKEVSNINYELDLEVQWTNVAYDLPNAELCIFGGTMGSEDLQVDVWNGSAWHNLFTDLSSGWNNVSVSSYLDSPIFTIRIKGGTETSDSTQDSWNIDVALLHVWSDEYTVEVEFTGSSSTENWNQLNWTVDLAWTTGSVNVTLQLYNYTLDEYPVSGNGYMTYTSNVTPNTEENKTQTINVNPTHFRNATGYWKMKIKGVKTTDVQFDLKIDWVELKAKKINGTLFTFRNSGSLTTHLVSLWIINSTVHRRYEIDVFINLGETLSYLRNDVHLSNEQHLVKVITERGNIAVYSNT